MSRGRVGLIKAIKEVRYEHSYPCLNVSTRSHALSVPVSAAAAATTCRPVAGSPPPVTPPAALHQIFREVKFFGDAEVSALKKELEAHKLQLEQLKQARAVCLANG